MDDQNRRAEQLERLQRLDDAELVVLNERWAGRTSSEIAGALRISQSAARFHLGNIYDKLEVTYVRGGTSLSRIMAYYSVLDHPNAPRIPRAGNLADDELTSPTRPSDQALELVQDDDEALLAQRPVRPAADETVPPGRGWIWPAVAVGIAAVLVTALLLILLLDDDGDDEDIASAETATAFTMNLDASATALAEQATLSQQDLDATATALSVVATQQQEAAAQTSTEAAVATASAQPTETPTPTEEPTATPEPTETPEPTPTPEPTNTPEPDATSTEAPEPPAPIEGELVYEANWELNADEWQLDDDWTVEANMLRSANSGWRSLLAAAPIVDLGTADYAVEAVITVTELDACDGVTGVLGRAAMQAEEDVEFLSGYAGAACRTDWQILLIPEDSPDADELQAAEFEEFELDDQPHAYRLEMVGDTIRFFLDGEFIGEAADDSYQDAGEVGIYLDGDINVIVASFRVFVIEPA